MLLSNDVTFERYSGHKISRKVFTMGKSALSLYSYWAFVMPSQCTSRTCRQRASKITINYFDFLDVEKVAFNISSKLMFDGDVNLVWYFDFVFFFLGFFFLAIINEISFLLIPYKTIFLRY